ncbi:MAG: molybdopterin-dependent oxidoreductase [Dehalococcoidia bacterium]|nr:molybdopterin-dependent oxidoreductase [Dehalococcoidia bacterium]
MVGSDLSRMSSDTLDKEVITSVCGICPGGCGVQVEMVDGKIDRVLPLKDHPMGIVCVRGAHAKEVVYSPDRLKHPLARVGEKGEGRFERISWDQAFERITDKLEEIKRTTGPEAVMTYMGRGVFDVSLVEPFAPPGVDAFSPKSLIFPFGSPNNSGCGSLCFVSWGLMAPVTTLGMGMGAMSPDYANSNLIVVWGANPATDSPPMTMKKIMEARRRGARVIVIDHMRSEMAARADQFIPVRSGTDGALALGMINTIIKEGLYDKEFVGNWTVGFKELSQYASEFTPTEVEAITRVPADIVVETARAIANTRQTTFCTYTGLEYTNSAVQSIRALLVLWGITGHLDEPGGMVMRPKGKGLYNRTDVPPPEGVKPIGEDKYPLFTRLTKSAHFMEAPRAILEGDPYPVKALLIFGGSILTGYPDPELWKRCMAKLELLVCVDRFMTGDAQYADFVLPATTYFENHGYQRYPNYVQLRQRVIEPIEEARSDYSIFAELAGRLGYGHLYPRSEEDSVEFVLKDHPVSLEQLREHPEGVRFGKPAGEYKKYEKGLLREDGRPGFATPSGKMEIVSSLLMEYGYDGLPAYTEPKEGPLASPELARRYPLVLNTGARIQSTFRSQHLNIPGLLKLQPEPFVLINPQDAEARAIVNGERVWVESPRGRVPFTAKVTDAVLTGEVEVNMGGGSPIQPKAWQEANPNYLTDPENRDPISGFPVLKALLCEIYPYNAKRA